MLSRLSELSVCLNLYKYKSCISLNEGYIFTRVHLLVCWFFSTMTRKLLSEFPLNLDGGCVSAQSRTSLTLGVDLDKETDSGF